MGCTVKAHSFRVCLCLRSQMTWLKISMLIHFYKPFCPLSSCSLLLTVQSVKREVASTALSLGNLVTGLIVSGFGSHQAANLPATNVIVYVQPFRNVFTLCFLCACCVIDTMAVITVCPPESEVVISSYLLPSSSLTISLSLPIHNQY